MQEFSRSDIIYEDDTILFHNFHGAGNKGKVLIIPPHAGRHPNICQNMADALSAIGLDTYAFEIKAANLNNRRTSIGDLVNKINTCMNIIGAPVDMFGICQGGWLSSIYTASSLNRGRVKKLSLFAAPINTKTGEKNTIEKYCKTIDLAIHKLMIDLNGGVQDGWWQWFAFTAANPTPMLYTRYAKLANLYIAMDYVGVQKWIKQNLWLDSPQDLAGVWFMEAMRNHFTNNDLYEGRMVVNGERIDLSNITCDVRVYTGKVDPVTHWKQAVGILHKASSTVKYHFCFDGEGHTGPFTKPGCIQKALTDIYGGHA